MVDYSKAKIYRLVGGGHTYYGSTCNDLRKRKSQHKWDRDRWLKGNHRYMSSYKCVETEDYDIYLVEAYPCKNKDELNARERWWIENNECVNMVIPTRPKAETDRAYRAKQGEALLAKKREYVRTHKKEEAERKGDWYEKNKERILLERKIKYMFYGKGN